MPFTSTKYLYKGSNDQAWGCTLFPLVQEQERDTTYHNLIQTRDPTLAGLQYITEAHHTRSVSLLDHAEPTCHFTSVEHLITHRKFRSENAGCCYCRRVLRCVACQGPTTAKSTMVVSVPATRSVRAAAATIVVTIKPAEIDYSSSFS
jgi:hypothetical protein